MYEVDDFVTIYCGALTDQAMRDAAIKLMKPSKGIHVEWIKRTRLGDHRVRIAAPNRAVFNKIRDQFFELTQ